MSRRHVWESALPLVAALLLTGACNGPGAAKAGDVAQSFAQLVRSDPASACSLLSGHSRDALEKNAKAPCAQALSDADLPDPSPVQSVDVYGHDARVVLRHDVVFLARFPDGWRVTAAGCAPRPDDLPYDCALSGG